MSHDATQTTDEIDAFDFALPDAQIAATPAPARAASRCLELARDGFVHHATFADAVRGALRPGDLLVVNDVRVAPLRLEARKATGGAVEVLLLGDAIEEVEPGCWRASAFVKSRRPVDPREALSIVGAPATVRVHGRDAEGVSQVELRLGDRLGDLDALLGEAGVLPLPPYIVKQRRARGLPSYTDADAERYQTVYAARGLAVAAPTAGLHFTAALLAELESTGVERAAVTLDVGPGTFRPVRSATLDDHVMHAESYAIDASFVAAWEATRARGGRVIAVGTTSVRALEDQVRRFGAPREGTWSTRLFIKPGEAVRSVDALITNFHLPRSTLLVLVAAIAGHARTMEAYREAVMRGYRFYSYGDSMLVWPKQPERAR